MSIFEHASYIDVLREYLQIGDRGYQNRLAKAAQVHPSYFSRVLSEKVHLSPEQGFRLAQFWGLTEQERDYFENLILMARAGDPGYRAQLERRVKTARADALELQNRLSATPQETGEGNIYYVHWLYSALHILLTVPGFQSASALAKRLLLPVGVVEAHLRQLAELGLVRLKGTHWEVTDKNVILSRANWMARLQHSNWRVKNLERLGGSFPNDISYTGIHSLSRADLEKLRARLREFFVETDALVRPSREETVAVFCADLYEL